MDHIKEVETVSNSQESDTLFDMLNDLKEIEIVGGSVVDQEEDNENNTAKELRDNYVSMFEEAQKELYSLRTKFSAFSFLVKLIYIKVLNG